MTMADIRAKGTTMTFGENTPAKVKSVRVSGGIKEEDVTTFDSTEVESLALLRDRSVEVEIYGTTTIKEGDVGALAITFPTGNTSPDSMANAVCTKVDPSAQAGGLISTSLSFKKTPSDATNLI